MTDCEALIAGLQRLLDGHYEREVVESAIAALAQRTEPQQQAEPVLLNLALRLRLARRCLKQAISSGANQSYIDQLRGAETEAWNSFQAAKAIAAPPAVNPAPGYCPHCKQYTIEEPLLADDEAVRLLREARNSVCSSDLITAIDAYLAKVTSK